MQGKVAVVTGAAGGIGEGIVRKLGSKGVKVIGTGRTEAKLKGYEGDCCGECGNYTMVRNGTCMKCDTCGSTSGCS